MRITVLGGAGAWPTAHQGCSGYLVEHDGFRLLIDPGYATLPRLLAERDATEVDAVLVSHGHPDHCADLHPLLRARAFRDDPAPALPVYALPGAVDAVLALDRPGLLDEAYDLRGFTAGGRIEIGPFTADTRSLPHTVANAGIRLAAGDTVLAYTGDTGPSPEVIDLAQAADLLIAEATYPFEVPAGMARFLSSARQAGSYAAGAGVGRLLLTHLFPGTNADATLRAAAFDGPTEIAVPGLRLDL